IAVTDWSQAYSDVSARKAEIGLKVEDPVRGIRGIQLCEELRKAHEARIDEGLKMLQTAMEKRRDYEDAMEYMNLLYLRKADLACDDPAGRIRYTELSKEWADRAANHKKNH